MQSHDDRDSNPEAFFARLQARANKMRELQASVITSGAPSEEPLAQWTAEGIACQELPADPQGILRISIGGGSGTPVVLDYCVHRGNREECIALLRRALNALER